MDSHPYVPHPKHQELLEKHRLVWNGLLKTMLYSVIGIIGLLTMMAIFLTGHPHP